MRPLRKHDPVSIDRYRLQGRLGAGGMGQVYLGSDAGGRQVAIKVVHPGLSDDEQFRARFRREVEVSRRVTGSSVAAVVDADPDAEHPWLAVEYVPGPSLQEAVSEAGKLTPSAARRLGDGLAEALETIHAAGLVHRDVKPSNVLLDPQRPRLIDFGISRAFDSTALTSTGMVVGTPAFMSPEQISGQAVTAASDVFSLGAVLCFAATGRGPFGEGALVVLMMRISTGEPDLSGVPEELRRPVAACLAKDPGARPTPGDLRRMLEPTPPAATGAWPPGGAPHPADLARTAAPNSARRGISRRAWFGVAAAGLTVAAASGMAAYAGISAPPAAPPPEPPPQPGTGGARLRWSAPVEGPVTGAVRDGDVLFLHSYAEGALAIDTATGNRIWSVPDLGTDTPTVSVDSNNLASLARVGDVLIVNVATGMVAIDIPTARLLWTEPREGDLGVQHLGAADGIAVAPQNVVHPGGSVASESGEMLGEVVARDVATGARLWAAPNGTGLPGAIPVAVVDGLCIIDNGGLLEGRDLRTGSLRWTSRASNVPTNFVVATAGSVVAGDGGSVVGVDPATGGQRWTSDTDSARSVGHTYGRFAVDVEGDMLATFSASESRRVLVRDVRDGSWLAAAYDAAWEDGTDLLISDGVVYVLSTTGLLTAIDAATATGDELWTYEAPPMAAPTPLRVLLAGNGRSAFLHRSGALHAVGV